MPTILDVANIDQQRSQFEDRQVHPIQGSSVLAILEGKDDPRNTKVSQVGYELFGMKAYFADGWKILLMPKALEFALMSCLVLSDSPIFTYSPIVGCMKQSAMCSVI
ncbi:MAG: hypothetical protein WD000_06150 [Thermodesulfobacteriota bacterium]